MASIHVERIKRAMHKLFDKHIDMTDYSKKPAEIEKAFLSRALAAYALCIHAHLEPAEAAIAVTDGFNDNGIDSVHFDEGGKILYLCQSKWIENGKGSISRADCSMFLNGVNDILHNRLEKFNDKLRHHKKEICNAIFDANVNIILIVGHSGLQPLPEHARNDLDTFLEDQNNPIEVITSEILDQKDYYKGITEELPSSVVNLDIELHQWGVTEEPYIAYYGQVYARDIAKWWNGYGRKLLTRNIRYFKGSTEINDALEISLHENPKMFWYLNNGITILCSKILKKRVGGSDRKSGVFECSGVNIVNGAQTVGVIGNNFSLLMGIEDECPRVHVRLISLENCPDGFDKIVTRATNTQNRIESRDFVALDPNQKRIASEMQLDGKYYAYRSGDDVPSGKEGCNLTEATIALACANKDISYAVQAKREVGRLWSDIESAPYQSLFNDKTGSTEVWRAVRIMRAVDKVLENHNYTPLEMIAVHGNRLLLHRVFQSADIQGFRAADADMDQINKTATQIAQQLLSKLSEVVEDSYRNAYPASIFKNQKKCEEINQKLAVDRGKSQQKLF